MSSEHHRTSWEEMKFKGVYPSLESIFSVLKSEKFRNHPDVIDLLDIYKQNSLPQSVESPLPTKLFVVLEGLDGSGKTTLSKKLSCKLGGVALSTPPVCFLHLRDKFDAQDIQLRRAYYALGNYVTAAQIRKLTQKQPVILDRFWHSTAAYAMAHEVCKGNAELLPEGDDVYNWPYDLLKPDFIFFLSVSEEKRNQRFANRSTTTLEEDKLKMDHQFRQTAIKAYKWIRDPSAIMINANKFPKHVVLEILSKLPPCYQ